MELKLQNNIIVTWLKWQFYEVPAFLVQVWKNYLDFAQNLFSIGLLLKTFFSPWRRYNWQYPKGFDLYQFFLALSSNIFSRFLGALMRSVLIIIGIVFYILVIITGFLALVFWIFMPLLVIAGWWYVFIF